MFACFVSMYVHIHEAKSAKETLCVILSVWWSRPSLRPLSRSASSLISASNDVEVHVFVHKPLVNKASLSGSSRNWGFCPAGGNLSAAMTHSQHSRLDFHRQATQLTLTFMSFAPSRPSSLPRGSMKGWFRCWRWVWTTPMSLFGKQNNFYPFVPSTPNPLITHTNKPQVAVMNQSDTTKQQITGCCLIEDKEAQIIRPPQWQKRDTVTDFLSASLSNSDFLPKQIKSCLFSPLGACCLNHKPKW